MIGYPFGTMCIHCDVDGKLKTISKGVESNFVPYDRYKYRSRAQLQMIPASEPVVTISIDLVYIQCILTHTI